MHERLQAQHRCQTDRQKKTRPALPCDEVLRDFEVTDTNEALVAEVPHGVLDVEDDPLAHAEQIDEATAQEDCQPVLEGPRVACLHSGCSGCRDNFHGGAGARQEPVGSRRRPSSGCSIYCRPIVEVVEHTLRANEDCEGEEEPSLADQECAERNPTPHQIGHHRNDGVAHDFGIATVCDPLGVLGESAMHILEQVPDVVVHATLPVLRDA
mmetsp:Transcript_96459/g.312377  ORF Transcript_96459/g.312377 Transcript_96459/m.312377 type:complete len:211 (+) Transcript_96459:449-1081(+)